MMESGRDTFSNVYKSCPVLIVESMIKRRRQQGHLVIRLANESRKMQELWTSENLKTNGEWPSDE